MEKQPAESSQSPVREILLMGGVHLYGAVCFFIFGLIYWFLVHSAYMLLSNFVFGTLCALNWAFFTKFGRHKWFATSFLILVYLGLVNVVVHLGVYDSPLIYWGLSVAVAAAFIYSIRGILIWVVICLVFYPLCLFLKRGWFSQRAIFLDQTQTEILDLASYVGILLFLGFTFFLFQRKMRRVIGALAESEAKARALLVAEQKARKEAHQASLAKDVFLATLSHELRTPLTAIQTWAQLLKMGRLDSSKVKQGIEMIEKSAIAQGRIINDLLDISRVMSGKFQLEVSEVNPVELVNEALESFKETLQNKELRLHAIFDSSIGKMDADPVRFKQIVWNLLSNAIRFSEPKGEIEVRVERVDSASLEILVSDHGQGIPPELLERIFDPFTQADGSSVRKHGGLGLGLSIVRSLVVLHGGAVEAKSAGLGQGAQFKVILPFRSALNKLAEPRPGHSDSLDRVDLRGVRILLVDDEVSSLEALTNLLAVFGAEVKSVTSVTEAERSLDAFLPSIVLSDIAMPGEDGYFLIKKIRNHSSAVLRNLPVIALTAFGGVDEKQRTLAAGFDAHLEKPVDSSALLEAILKVLKKRPTR